jgi:DHA1 family tetracycline resistance protein-like MFS transporter
MYKFKWDEQLVGYSLAFIGVAVALVQGGLIRIIIPKIGQKKAVLYGMLLYALGLVLFSVAWEGWMMFVFLIPYAIAGIAGPAIQSLLSSKIPSNEQGELQGTITSLISITMIIGPALMTNLFYFFSSPDARIYFPGAPYLAGAIFTLIGFFIATRALKKFD